ncbi:translocation/assembly module TamB domain-containing protein [Desulfurivibrio alkaliphilus]|uniref:Translocation and assembly module TamB C-terminal domain-containing protein n=1 Tax=Desulfurivibrio alkaliphilus (strain DSM 19089 / UNIQEM U267 / AHT2) TaxID=589865 RepID=D6Z5S1_DESAT|nr:translocation/assembly module TamB domain-containing protein [Desulfurivibrio alkaliphilus]ADH86808.1 protein of unknown function DUF490 [Desulfurivibrio alkaliphilus AHT 2]
MPTRPLTISAVLLILLLLLAGTLYALRETVIGPRLLAAANGYLTPTLGLELTAAQVGGNYFNSLVLQDLRLTDAAPNGDPPLAVPAELEASQLRLSYHLPALRHGAAAFVETLRVELSRGELTLNLPPANEKTAPYPPEARNIGEIVAPAELVPLFTAMVELAPRLPTIKLEQMDFALYSGELALIAADLALDFNPALGTADAPTRLNLHSASFALQHPRLQNLQAPLHLEATAGRDHREGSLALARLDWGQLLTVSSGRLSWSGLETLAAAEETRPLKPQLELALQLQLLETALSGRARLTPEQWQGELTTGVFHLAQLEPFLVEPPRLQGDLALSGHLKTSPAAFWETLSGELALQLQQGAVAEHRLGDLELLARIQQGELHLPRLTAALGDNRLELERLQLPLPALHQADWRSLLDQSLVGELRVDFPTLPELLDATGLPWEKALPPPLFELTRHRLQLQADLQQGRLRLRDLHLTKGSDRLAVPRALIGPWPEDDDFRHLPLEGEIHLALGNLAEFTRRWQLPALGGRLQADLVLAGSPAEPQGFLNLEANALSRQEEELLEYMQIILRGDHRRLHLERLQLRHHDDYLQAGLILDPAPLLDALWADETQGLAEILAELNWEQLQASFELAELSPYTELLLPPWHISGRLQGEISGAGPLRQPQLAARLQALDLQLPAASELAALPKLDLVSVELEMARQQLRLSHLLIQHQQDRLEAHGLLRLPILSLPALPEPDTLELQELELNLAVAELAAYAALLPPELTGQGGHEGNGNGLPQVAASEMDTPVEAPFMAGALTARLQGEGNLADHSFRAEAELSQGRLADFTLQNFTGRASFSLPGAEPTAFQLSSDFQAHYLSYQERVVANELASDLSYAAGTLAIEQGEVLSDQARLLLGGELQGLGEETLTLLFHRLELAADDLTLALAAPGRLQFTGGRLHDAELEMEGLGAYLSLQGGYDPTVPGAELDFRARLHSDELSWLSPLLPGVRRVEGRLTAELELFGSLAEPQVRGGIELEEGELRPEGDTPAFREIRARADFDSQGLELLFLDGQWSGAPLAIRGRVDFPAAFPLAVNGEAFSRELRFNLTLQGEEVLFYRAEGIRVRGRTDLTLTGPLAALRLAGEVGISEGRYTRNVDFLEMFRAPGAPRRPNGLRLFSLTAPPWRDMTFNIRIIADQPFVVHNIMARGSLRPNLRLTGSGELPVLSGEIFLDPTRLTLPSGRFQIESGLIRFPDHDPDRAEFDLLATARLLGYDVSVVLQGTADEPILTLSSSPPLGDDELLLLVLTGQPPAAVGHETARRRAGMSMAVFLGRDLLARIFHGDEPPSDEAILERFHIDVGRNITRSGDETIEAELRLVDDLIRPGDRLFITSEKDIYDDFNIGLKIVFRFR